MREKIVAQRVVSRHLMTTGRSQSEVKLQFGRQSRRGWKECDSSLLSLKLISLCILQIASNKYFIVKTNLGFCYF